MASPGTANVVEGNRVSTIDDIIRRLMGTTRAEHQGWEPMQLHESDSISIHEAQKILRTGDTLVYIDFPDPELGHKLSDCRGIPYQSMVLRVSSEKLLATGSQRFKDLLGPNNQRRVLRMRKLVGKLPAGVKYVLDLTPSLEGDEQVQEMCELSVPPGVAAWWKAEAVYHVSHRLCGGHDDVCDCAVEAATEARERHMRPRTPPGASTSSTEPSPTSSPSSRDASTTKFAVRKDPKFRNIPDYCLIRHRVNIIRLLLAIESSDHDRYILLNSAPRLWTMVGLSKLFDCTNVVVSTLSDQQTVS